MLIGPQNLPVALAAVRERIARAAVSAGRDPADVTLVAVGKTQPAEVLRAAAAAGVTDFGENYLQEAETKIDLLADLPLTWHYIGRVQANKTRAIASRFAWVHGLDRIEIARRLSDQRSPHLPPLQVCIQVALVAEAGKGGLPPAAVPELAGAVVRLPRLRLRGLMCLPPALSDPQRQHAVFTEMRALRERMNAEGFAMDVLSMGMSGDFEAAIAAGATHVRIGTALFGERH
ncbi:MAG: YggS family pyridoxal phosphate-dependent enzyme [Gammaproteobacteria bacterium]|nr:YggS family pyridoxal phosphate-dependent enzyme [Gammaproteobacteria bacterium]MDE2304855.1 YggS family pyridoxal phosphate-dependent enzyme [Gammaproteobacteria bacterium]